MGSTEYSMFLTGPNLTEAYDDAVARDRAEYGSDSYSGTIKNSYGVRPVTSQVCTRAEAAFLAGNVLHGPSFYERSWVADPAARAEEERVAKANGNRQASQLLARLGVPGPSSWQEAMDMIPNVEKGGQALAIPVGPDDVFTIGVRGIPLDVTALGLQDSHAWHPEVLDHVHRALADQLGAAPRIAGITQVDDNPRFVSHVSSTDGAVVTRYRVYSRSSYGGLIPAPGVPPLPSMAAARAAVKDIVKTSPSTAAHESGELELVVLGEKVREDGSPLIVAKRTLASRLVIYKADLVRRVKPDQQIIGWHVFGSSPS